MLVQEYFCYECKGYAVIEARPDNSIRVTVCNCQFEEENN